MFAPSHFPANRYGVFGRVRMRCYTWAHTRQVVAVVTLMISRAYGSPGETQLLVSDVDCKYLAVVYTTQVGVWLSLYALSCHFCVIPIIPENFTDLLHYKAHLSRLLSFVWYVLDCLHGTMGGDCFWLFGGCSWLILIFGFGPSRHRLLGDRFHDNPTPGLVARYKQKKPWSAQDTPS